MRAKGKSEENQNSDTARLETIIELIYQDLINEGARYKVSDLIRAIELKRKMSSNSGAENSFWKMIEKLRQEESNSARTKPGGNIEVSTKASKAHGRRKVVAQQ